MFAIRKMTVKAQKAASAATSVASSAANAAAHAATSAASSTKRKSSSAKAPSGFTLRLDMDSDKSDSEDKVGTGEEVKIVSNEETFISAIENGEVSTFMDMLYRKEELDLDINNIKDINGLSPLRLAIIKGLPGTVGQLLKHGANVGDALLRAVDVGFFETVKIICEYAGSLKSGRDRLAILDCHCEDDDFHPDVTPIVLAAQRNEFAIVKVLTEAGMKIRYLSKKKNNRRGSFARETFATDDLQKSVGAIEVYRGLASEAYLVQGHEDPIEAAFTLSRKLSDLGQKDVEFKSSYAELAEQVDQVSPELISHARSTEEILSILTYSDKGKFHKNETSINNGPLPKISKAINFQQKSFVAHPNCQQAVLAKFYGKQAFLRDQSSKYTFMYLLLMILGFPFLSLAYLYLPIQKVKDFFNCPYSKFTLKLASDLFFVVLLTIDTIVQPGITNDLSLETPSKALLLVWILGIAWRIIKDIHRHGASALTDSGQWRDILLVSLFLVAVFFDIVSYVEYQMEDETVVTSKLRRDAHFQVNAGSDYRYFPPPNLTLDIERELPFVLHRIPRATRPRSGEAKDGSDQGTDIPRNYTNENFQAFVDQEWWQPKLIATTMFALSTVISFLRMLPYFVVSAVAGPFQISLGSMVAKTANFFVVVGIVLLSFAVGLTSLYAYYTEINSLTCGGSSGVECIKDHFSNLYITLLYLFWSVMGTENQEPLYLQNQAVIIEDAGQLLYALFYVLMVLVLLNALIAVMSEAYNSVEENADLEWKFHSTAMWMSILLDDNVVPPPFNLLPSVYSIKAFVDNRANRKGSVFAAAEQKKLRQEEMKNNALEKAQYKRVINKLVERYVTAKTKAEVSVSADVTMTDILGLKNELQGLKLDIFQRLFETNYLIHKTTDEGIVIRSTSEKANRVLSKVGEIHDDVDTVLVKHINDLQSHKISQQVMITNEIERIEKSIYLRGLFSKEVGNAVPAKKEDNSSEDSPEEVNKDFSSSQKNAPPTVPHTKTPHLLLEETERFNENEVDTKEDTSPEDTREEVNKDFCSSEKHAPPTVAVTETYNMLLEEIERSNENKFDTNEIVSNDAAAAITENVILKENTEQSANTGDMTHDPANMSSSCEASGSSQEDTDKRLTPDDTGIFSRLIGTFKTKSKSGTTSESATTRIGDAVTVKITEETDGTKPSTDADGNLTSAGSPHSKPANIEAVDENVVTQDEKSTAGEASGSLQEDTDKGLEVTSPSDTGMFSRLVRKYLTQSSSGAGPESAAARNGDTFKLIEETDNTKQSTNDDGELTSADSPFVDEQISTGTTVNFENQQFTAGATNTDYVLKEQVSTFDDYSAADNSLQDDSDAGLEVITPTDTGAISALNSGMTGILYGPAMAEVADTYPVTKDTADVEQYSMKHEPYSQPENIEAVDENVVTQEEISTASEASGSSQEDTDKSLEVTSPDDTGISASEKTHDTKQSANADGELTSADSPLDNEQISTGTTVHFENQQVVPTAGAANTDYVSKEQVSTIDDYSAADNSLQDYSDADLGVITPTDTGAISTLNSGITGISYGPAMAQEADTYPIIKYTDDVEHYGMKHEPHSQPENIEAVDENVVTQDEKSAAGEASGSSQKHTDNGLEVTRPGDTGIFSRFFGKFLTSSSSGAAPESATARKGDTFRLIEKTDDNKQSTNADGELTNADLTTYTYDSPFDD